MTMHLLHRHSSGINLAVVRGDEGVVLGTTGWNRAFLLGTLIWFLRFPWGRLGTKSSSPEELLLKYRKDLVDDLLRPCGLEWGGRVFVKSWTWHCDLGGWKVGRATVAALQCQCQRVDMCPIAGVRTDAMPAPKSIVHITINEQYLHQ